MPFCISNSSTPSRSSNSRFAGSNVNSELEPSRVMVLVLKFDLGLGLLPRAQHIRSAHHILEFRGAFGAVGRLITHVVVGFGNGCLTERFGVCGGVRPAAGENNCGQGCRDQMAVESIAEGGDGSCFHGHVHSYALGEVAGVCPRHSHATPLYDTPAFAEAQLSAADRSSPLSGVRK